MNISKKLLCGVLIALAGQTCFAATETTSNIFSRFWASAWTERSIATKFLMTAATLVAAYYCLDYWLGEDKAPDTSSDSHSEDKSAKHEKAGNAAQEPTETESENSEPQPESVQPTNAQELLSQLEAAFEEDQKKIEDIFASKNIETESTVFCIDIDRVQGLSDKQIKLLENLWVRWCVEFDKAKDAIVEKQKQMAIRYNLVLLEIQTKELLKKFASAPSHNYTHTHEQQQALLNAKTELNSLFIALRDAYLNFSLDKTIESAETVKKTFKAIDLCISQTHRALLLSVFEEENYAQFKTQLAPIYIYFFQKDGLNLAEKTDFGKIERNNKRFALQHAQILLPMEAALCCEPKRAEAEQTASNLD